jgi:hypothetical protein
MEVSWKASMNNTLENRMREATRLTRAGGSQEATEARKYALRDSIATGAAPRAEKSHVGVAGNRTRGTARSVSSPPLWEGSLVDAHAGRREFSSGSYTHSWQTRDYKLYAPPNHRSRKLPLVVMLHGCTQDPDDFAAGTGMNNEA